MVCLILADVIISIGMMYYLWVNLGTVYAILITNPSSTDYQGHRAEAEWQYPFGVPQVCQVHLFRPLGAGAQTEGGQSKFVAIVRRTVETNSATLVRQIIGIILIARNAGGLWFSEAGELPSNRGLSSDFIVKVLIDKVTTKLYLFALIGSC